MSTRYVTVYIVTPFHAVRRPFLNMSLAEYTMRKLYDYYKYLAQSFYTALKWLYNDNTVQFLKPSPPLAETRVYTSFESSW